jgi:hypothetical protein
MTDVATVHAFPGTPDRLALAEEAVSRLCGVIADLDRQADATGWLNELREQRISAIEEVIAAGWPQDSRHREIFYAGPGRDLTS